MYPGDRDSRDSRHGLRLGGSNLSNTASLTSTGTYGRESLDLTRVHPTEEEDEEVDGLSSDFEPLQALNTFKDYNSCDRVLTDLEARIKNWHSLIPEEKPRRAKPLTVKLHRLIIDVSI